MKKAILVIIIFSFLAISFTATMIKLEESQRTLDMVIPDNLMAENNYYNLLNAEKIQEDTKMNNKTPRNPVILGQTTYRINPITERYILSGEYYDHYTWNAEYVQISGLKNKQVQNSINDYLKNNKIKITGSGIANTLSIGDYNGRYYLNFNLIDGQEITINDYLYDPNDLKDVLPKYILRSIYNAFDVGTYYSSVWENYDEGYYKDELERGLLTQEWIDNAKKYQEKAQRTFEKFNEVMDDWQLEIMNKYEKGDFGFFFTSKELHLLFNDIYFENPTLLELDSDR